MPLTGGSSSTNDIPSSVVGHQQQQTLRSSTSSNNNTGPSATTAIVRPMRSQSQSVAITVDQQQQPARAVSATSCTSDESEESLPDSLEEGRAPLLRRPQSALLEDGYQQEGGGGEAQNGGGTVEDNNSGRDLSKVGRKIPRERRKAGFAFLFLVFAGALNDIVLSYIHELIPDTKPLPDFAFTYAPYWPSFLIVSECLMITSFAAMFTIAIAHKYRWVVIRRIFTIGALLYLGRCLTMFVTQVPVADSNYYCSPKLTPEERTFWAIFSRAMSVLIGLGLKINGRHTLCGDYIYSGHTIVHVICCLFILEYSPRRWLPLHWLSILFSTVGVLSLLVSRGHYSIDVIIAYWISTRIFWLYHTLADLPALRTDLQGRNKMIKTIWFRLFMFMEGGVQRPVPRKYEVPFTMPSRLRRWWRRRHSQHGSGGGPDADRLIDG